MFREDGERVAKLLYSKLKESKNGELSFDEIINIYDKLDFPLFRKAEFFTWEWLKKRSDVDMLKDEKSRTYLKYEPKEMCVECGEDKPYRELGYGQEPICYKCRK